MLGSRLRTGMTRDVGTRRTFLFRGVDAPDPLLQAGRYRERTLEHLPGTRRRSLTLLVTRSARGPFAERPSELVVDGTRIQVEEGGWDPGRMAVTTRVPGSGTGRRLLLIKRDELVEGRRGGVRDRAHRCRGFRLSGSDNRRTDPAGAAPAR